VRGLLQTLTRLSRLVGCVAALAVVMGAATVVVAPQVGQIVGAHTSLHETINLDRLAEGSVMYDRNGARMAVLSRENRVPVKLKDVSPRVIDAILAVEDNNFYRHKGVNVRSMVRAFRSNVDQGSVSQGGSTITQQVVKNSVVGNQRTLSRKLREAFLATELEKQMSKDQILERYLNSVYFGNNAYGVQAAAKTYFDKDVKDLDWSEGALLAALISNPNGYDPIARPSAAFHQRALAFDRLVETHKLSRVDAQFANLVPLPHDLHIAPPPEGYFTQDVVARLLDDTRLGSTPSARYNAVFRGGLRIYTTFDPGAQQKAETARNTTMPGGKGDGTFDAVDKNGVTHLGTAAIVSIEPQSGAVRVMVGGVDVDPKLKKYNLADNDRGRQPGSSFKTFVLAAGIEQGMVPDDTVDGTSPCPGIRDYDVAGIVPHNYGDSAGLVGTLTQQVQQSSNCAFLRLGQIVGIPNAIGLAKRMGVVHTPLNQPTASAAIGTNNVTPFDMAAAYSVFANDGVRVDPYLIDRVEDSSGKVIFKHKAAPERIMSTQTARLVTQVLVSNVLYGTGTRAQLTNGQQAGGKTGTTENATDLWFVGYTPQLATAVWMGAVDRGDISLSFGGGDATGGVYAATTWGAYMNDELAQVPLADFGPPGPTRAGRYLQMGVDNGLTGPGPDLSAATSTASAPPDTGVPAPPDTGVPTPPDTGVPAPPDTGVPAPPDTGLPAPFATSVPPPPDTGLSPAVTAPAATVPPATLPPATLPPATLPPATVPAAETGLGPNPIQPALAPPSAPPDQLGNPSPHR